MMISNDNMVEEHIGQPDENHANPKAQRQETSISHEPSENPNLHGIGASSGHPAA